KLVPPWWADSFKKSKSLYAEYNPKELSLLQRTASRVMKHSTGTKDMEAEEEEEDEPDTAEAMMELFTDEYGLPRWAWPVIAPVLHIDPSSTMSMPPDEVLERAKKLHAKLQKNEFVSDLEDGASLATIEVDHNDDEVDSEEGPAPENLEDLRDLFDEDQKHHLLKFFSAVGPHLVTHSEGLFDSADIMDKLGLLEDTTAFDEQNVRKPCDEFCKGSGAPVDVKCGWSDCTGCDFCKGGADSKAGFTKKAKEAEEPTPNGAKKFDGDIDPPGPNAWSGPPTSGSKCIERKWPLDEGPKGTPFSKMFQDAGLAQFGVNVTERSKNLDSLLAARRRSTSRRRRGASTSRRRRGASATGAAVTRRRRRGAKVTPTPKPTAAPEVKSRRRRRGAKVTTTPKPTAAPEAKSRRRRRGSTTTATTVPPEKAPEEVTPAPKPGATGCVPVTEFTPVKGSEDCASRGVVRRDEMPGFEPMLGKFAATDGLKLGRGCGKVCPRKYLIGQYWLPKELYLDGPQWQDAAHWCASRGMSATGPHSAAVSFFSKNNVCEVFSDCPAEEMVDGSSREHQKGPPACPWQYDKTKQENICVKKVNPDDALKKCSLMKKGSGVLVRGLSFLEHQSCAGDNMDEHNAMKLCINTGGEYKGLSSTGYVCYFASDEERETYATTWIFKRGKNTGRKMKWKENSKCNLECGAVRTWHIGPTAKYSRLMIMPKAKCGECRVQRTWCPNDEDGHTSFQGYTYAGVSEVHSADGSKFPREKDFAHAKRNFICCKMHMCTSSVATDWKDEEADKTPCESSPGDISFKYPPGTDAWTYGRMTPMSIKGKSASSINDDGNKCFQLKKYFRPHSDFFEWIRTGKTKEKLCLPKKEEVAVAGSEVCSSLSSVGQCLSKPGVCKWVPPEQGECVPKVVPGSDSCEGPSTTCPAGKRCEPPKPETGCDYPWFKEAMNDLPPWKQKFTAKGELKADTVITDEDAGGWAGLKGSYREFNTTWHTLGEHGWKGSNDKCVTRVYEGNAYSPHLGQILGLACKPRPIDHPKLAWNGEPCTKASSSKQCGEHSEICEWKPGPKCDIKFYHKIMHRCVLCKQYSKFHKPVSFPLPTFWRTSSYCRQCATFQLYYSKGKSELACHILKHFYGLEPDITSRIDVIPEDPWDHGKSPLTKGEFTFDGKRTCVMATGSFMQEPVLSKEDQKKIESKQMGPDEIIENRAKGKGGEFCEGGRYLKSLGMIKGKLAWAEDFKNRVEIGSTSVINGPYLFDKCNQVEDSVAERGAVGRGNFYQALEALAEAIKNGGVHPECKQKTRPVQDSPAISKDMASEANKVSWDLSTRTDVAKEHESRFVPHLFKKFGKQCPVHYAAKLSKAVCESFFMVKNHKKWPCVWMPNAVPSPYPSSCRSGEEIHKKKAELSKCGPDDADAPKECNPKCVTPAKISSRQSFTLYNPCTRFLNTWGYCGCRKSHSTGGSTIQSVDCRGCSKANLDKILGHRPCSEVGKGIPPELCLSLKANGVKDEDIGKISMKGHWAHGMEYWYGGTPTCVAAGQPGSTCTAETSGWATRCDIEDIKKIQAKGDGTRSLIYSCTLGDPTTASLWCSGSSRFPATGMTVEVSHLSSGTDYGSWGAQATELKRAVENKGEHPNCPAATVRPDAEPCIDVEILTDPKKRTMQANAIGGKTTRVCDNDCEQFRLPVKKNTIKGAHRRRNGKLGPPAGLKCGLRQRYPALRSPDAFLMVGTEYQTISRIIHHVLGVGGKSADHNMFWKLRDAGYDMGPAPLYGHDAVDGKYLGQDYNLFKTEIFGGDICSENRPDLCDGRSGKAVFKVPIPIPGCRKDMSPKLTCGGGRGMVNGRGSQCICHNQLSPEENPNFIKGLYMHTAVDSSSMPQRRQGPFECWGVLADLAPGESIHWGFRCKADENMPPYEYMSYNYDFNRPKNLSTPMGAGFLGDTQRLNIGVGRFSAGEEPVKSCVRIGVRCNGECNCGDCSDEEDCDKKPEIVGPGYYFIGRKTKLKCRHGEPKPLPKGIIDCDRWLDVATVQHW
ncbi:MAG: hypothetical protein CMO44_10940, partial [Verrucomicrobiales bacterium]|nr:hypothetical protein [Verrucomicrobiales bacterium]